MPDLKDIKKLGQIAEDVRAFVFDESQKNDIEHSRFSRDISILDNKIENKSMTPGPKGDKGDMGPRGPQGATGSPGRDGKDGINGRDGKDGKDGKQGKIGPRGQRGPKGDKGDKGDRGPAGKDGKDTKQDFSLFSRATYPAVKKDGSLLTTGVREINFKGTNVRATKYEGSKIEVEVLDDQPGTEVLLDTTNFNGLLSSADDTAQKAFDTLDDHTHPHTDLTEIQGNGEVHLSTTEKTNHDAAYTHSQITDGTNPHSVNHNNLNNLTWSTAGHTIDTDVDLATNNLLNVGTLNLNATSDHTIADSSDILILTNPNSQKGIYFNTGNGTVSGNHFFFNPGGNGAFEIVPSGSYNPTGAFTGMIKVGGTWEINSIHSAMDFSPNSTGSGQFIGFFVHPTIAVGAIAFRYAPTLSASISSTSTHTLLQSQFPTSPPDKTTTFTDYDDGKNRTVLGGATATTNATFNGFKLGGTLGALSFSGQDTNVTDYILKLSGGVSEASISGTATAKQYGIYMTGFGGTQPTNGEMYALLANGGLFSHKYDYNGTTSGILLGAGEDAGIGYNGTNLILEPDLVGGGAVQVKTGQALALIIGEGAAGVDYQLKFDGETNDGIITWLEDEDHFGLEDDFVFTVSGAGFPYGGCHGNEIAWTQTSAVQNTWYQISDADMADGELNLVTHDGNGKLTATKAGRYLIIFTCSAESSLTNKHIQLGVSINGGNPTYPINHFEIITANTQIEVSGNAIINLAANDTVEVAMRTTDTGTPTLSVDHLNLTINQVGG